MDGGALIVLNGSQAGQIRRIVRSADPSRPRHWTLDSPLQGGGPTGFDSDAFVQILPFRGRNLFFRNRLSDVGALQFYGIGLENIVSENSLARMAGIVSWGQWRGLAPAPAPPPSAGAGTSAIDSSSSSTSASSIGSHEHAHSEGEMGCGANPNMYNIFERNTFAEGNTIVNYNTAEGASFNFGAGYLLASTSGGGAGGATGKAFEQLSMNTFTVFRDNLIESNGGILITDDSTNILVEGNTIRLSELAICVRNSTRNVVVRANDARTACFGAP